MLSGAQNSIHFVNVKLVILLINDANNSVRVVVGDNTDIQKVEVTSGSKIEIEEESSAKIGVLIIEPTSKQNIELINVDSEVQIITEVVIISSDDMNIKIQEGIEVVIKKDKETTEEIVIVGEGIDKEIHQDQIKLKYIMTLIKDDMVADTIYDGNPTSKFVSSYIWSNILNANGITNASVQVSSNNQYNPEYNPDGGETNTIPDGYFEVTISYGEFEEKKIIKADTWTVEDSDNFIELLDYSVVKFIKLAADITIQSDVDTKGKQILEGQYKLIIKDTISPIADILFEDNAITLSFNENVMFNEIELSKVDISDKVAFIKSLFVQDSKYDLLDLAMEPENIFIEVESHYIALVLHPNALKQNIMQYLDDPDFSIEGYPALEGNKDGIYRMDAEIDLSKFEDSAGNKVDGSLIKPFKIEFKVTVNEGTPDYTTSVEATFIQE